MDGNGLTIKVKTPRGRIEEYTKVQGDQQLKMSIPEASRFQSPGKPPWYRHETEIISSNFKKLNIEHNEVFIAGGKAEVQSGSAINWWTVQEQRSQQHTLRIKLKGLSPTGEWRRRQYTPVLSISYLPGCI